MRSQPSYEHQFVKGDNFAHFVQDKLKSFGYDVGLYETKHEQFEIGESRMGLEIKFDDQLASTGNVYIEMYEKTRATNRGFVESGILRVDNSISYGVGNRQEFFIFGKWMLQRVYLAFSNGFVPDDDFAPPSQKDFIEREISTSKGFTLKRYLAVSWAEKYFKANEAGDWFDAHAVSRSYRVDDLKVRKR